ncbi:MAG: hypothetical protein DSY42_04915 [Aquifex sp.]|nr:MAG: hypothetical protein DSY42_04915 [Aquifex sp.]
MEPNLKLKEALWVYNLFYGKPAEEKISELLLEVKNLNIYEMKLFEDENGIKIIGKNSAYWVHKNKIFDLNVKLFSENFERLLQNINHIESLRVAAIARILEIVNIDISEISGYIASGYTEEYDNCSGKRCEYEEKYYFFAFIEKNSDLYLINETIYKRTTYYDDIKEEKSEYEWRHEEFYEKIKSFSRIKQVIKLI